MPNFTGLGYQPAFSSVATAVHVIGQQAISRDGRRYRYVLCGATALVVGNCIQSRIEDVDHDNVTARATAVGATDLLITAGASGGALDANEYAEGYAVIDTTPGLGYVYRISSHAAIAASANGTIVLDAEDGIQVALTGTSRVTLVASPYSKVIQSPVTTNSGTPVGGAIYPIVAAEYGWIQSGGLGAALISGTPAVGQPVTNQGTVAGALTVHSAELNEVALMAVTGRDAKVLPVYWLLD
mgnify:CR=1 FL=1